ncbi:MAG: ABC transporter substrate-binding protein [Candidatus Rokubacteria bacterium]|nr:ABC transporter substrate-binding protein [Candidatus Rokubacteria bacterium]MBI2554626.1 ABC transporter substrate-binding protein [Candidatus Rokubacteria bacterium]
MRGVFKSRVGPWLSLLAVGVLVLVAALPTTVTSQARPSGAPAELKIGFVDFFSGAGATFGASGKTATEWLVDKYNSEGGIGGVKLKVVIVDEAGGPDKQVTELRRLALDEKVNAVVGYTSSANCLAIAPVAEELKVLTVVHICGTHRLTEDRPVKYVFRTSNTQASDSVALARYVLSAKPDVKTIAGANEDYAWGRDSWEAFKIAMQRLKPDVQVVGELWTKFQAGEYSAEISKLLAAKPDVIHSSFWGGGLITFVNQAGPRGLFKQSQVLFSTGEQVLQDLKTIMPDGVIVAPRTTGAYFLDPDPAKNPMQKEFVEGHHKRFGRYPDYPAYRTYQAWSGLKAAYEKAIKQAGRWPTTEEVIKAFEGLSWETPSGTITMRPDHQAVHGGIVGITKMSPKHGFAILDRVVRLRADDVAPPLGTKTLDWVGSLKK